jgi:hypothetical protein
MQAFLESSNNNGREREGGGERERLAGVGQLEAVSGGSSNMSARVEGGGGWMSPEGVRVKSHGTSAEEVTGGGWARAGVLGGGASARERDRAGEGRRRTLLAWYVGCVCVASWALGRQVPYTP